jgi:hypothetical protein
MSAMGGQPAFGAKLDLEAATVDARALEGDWARLGHGRAITSAPSGDFDEFGSCSLGRTVEPRLCPSKTP